MAPGGRRLADGDAVRLHDHRLAGQADHPLDERDAGLGVRILLGDLPDPGRVEDDDVVAVRRVEPVDEAGHQHPVADHQRRLHRRRGDPVGLDDPAVDHVPEPEGADQDQHQLEQRVELAALRLLGRRLLLLAAAGGSASGASAPFGCDVPLVEGERLLGRRAVEPGRRLRPRRRLPAGWGHELGHNDRLSATSRGRGRPCRPCRAGSTASPGSRHRCWRRRSGRCAASAAGMFARRRPR